MILCSVLKLIFFCIGKQKLNLHPKIPQVCDVRATDFSICTRKFYILIARSILYVENLTMTRRMKFYYYYYNYFVCLFVLGKNKKKLCSGATEWCLSNRKLLFIKNARMSKNTKLKFCLVYVYRMLGVVCFVWDRCGKLGTKPI